MDQLTEVAPGVYTWRAVHPEWNTETERVASYALRFDEGLLLVDPLLNGTERGALLDELRALAGGGEVHAYITIPYHVRDVETTLDELGDGDGDGKVIGHRALVRKLVRTDRLVDWGSADELPFGVRAVEVGDPRRHERPLYSATHRALAFGDLVVGIRGGLRVWHDFEDGDESWYQAQFMPALTRLRDLDVDHVLTTHGEPVIGTGRTALGGLRAEPVRSIRGELTGDAARP
jgi:hypothetical protein